MRCEILEKLSNDFCLYNLHGVYPATSLSHIEVLGHIIQRLLLFLKNGSSEWEIEVEIVY